MTRPPTPRPIRSALPGALLGLLLVVLSACSGRPAGDEHKGDQEPIAQCDAFLSAYEHCLESLGPADIARARIEQTRASFASQLTGDGAARAALRKKCTDNLSQLKTTCR